MRTFQFLPVLALAASLLSTVPAFGQGNTGSILGTVTDASSAVVPNAKITITNTRTGVTADVNSDGSGNYLFNFLQPGQAVQADGQMLF